MTTTIPPLSERYDIRADQALAVVVEARIGELWRERRWWRTNRWADWPDIRRDSDIELRALVRLARTARRLTAPDPVTAAKGYADWTEAEKAFGR